MKQAQKKTVTYNRNCKIRTKVVCNFSHLQIFYPSIQHQRTLLSLLVCLG